MAAVLALLLPASAPAQLESLARFGEFGSGPGQLSSPAQIAVAADGDLYVADSGNDRISVFAGGGTFRRAFGQGKVVEPRDVALAGGALFVADSGNDRIDVFTSEGFFLFAFGAGELIDPTGLAVDGSTVLVADSGNDRVAEFTAAGAFLDSFGSAILSSPRDVIRGGDGLLYVADHDNERVAVFTAAGEFLRSVGTEAPGKLNGPVALVSEADEILVADQEAEQIERFGAAGSFLGGFAAEPGVAGVGVACAGNVFAVEQDTLFARIERFGEPGTPAPPCKPEQDPIVDPVSKPPSNRFRFAGLLRRRSSGTAVVFVRVPGPGKLLLYGRGVKRLRRTAARAKKAWLPIRPKIPLKRFLKQHGKARIRVNVTFEPFGGTPRTQEKPILLKRKRG